MCLPELQQPVKRLLDVTLTLLNLAGVDTHCQRVVLVYPVHRVAVAHQLRFIERYLVGIGRHLHQGKKNAVVEIVIMGIPLDVGGVGYVVEHVQGIVQAAQALEGIGLVKAGR